MPLDRYILVNRKPVSEPDLIKWARWFGQIKHRRVAFTKVGRSTVSTIFLGLDHRFSLKQKGKPIYFERTPILWETLVRGGKLNKEMSRCAGTWEQAEAMHQDMVKRVKASKPVTKSKK